MLITYNFVNFKTKPKFWTTIQSRNLPLPSIIYTDIPERNDPKRDPYPIIPNQKTKFWRPGHSQVSLVHGENLWKSELKLSAIFFLGLQNFKTARDPNSYRAVLIKYYPEHNSHPDKTAVKLVASTTQCDEKDLPKTKRPSSMTQSRSKNPPMLKSSCPSTIINANSIVPNRIPKTLGGRK